MCATFWEFGVACLSSGSSTKMAQVLSNYFCLCLQYNSFQRDTVVWKWITFLPLPCIGGICTVVLGQENWISFWESETPLHASAKMYVKPSVRIQTGDWPSDSLGTHALGVGNWNKPSLKEVPDLLVVHVYLQ